MSVSVSSVASVDAVVLTIGTPIDEHLNPAMMDVLEVEGAGLPDFDLKGGKACNGVLQAA